MKVFRTILIGVLLVMFALGVFWGFAVADSGSKKVGGYFDGVLAAIESDRDYYYITILNEKFTLRRF